MKPHIFAQMVNEVRDLARQYGHTEQFRCRVADLLKKYVPVEHGQGYPAIKESSIPQGDDPEYQREYAMTVGWIPRDEAFLAKRAEIYAERDRRAQAGKDGG